MRFGLIAYPKKPFIVAHSGVSRETSLESSSTCILCAKSESPGEVMRTCRPV